MIKEYFYIKNQNEKIPAILWGKPSDKLLIEVHGNLSNKEDTVISIMAEKALAKGYQVLSFDLPKHGDRLNDAYELNPHNCVSDLVSAYNYAKRLSSDISLFACSMGAYFSLLAYHDFDLKRSLFLSPVVNMEHIIDNMMKWFNVSEERLEKEKVIELPTGQTLEWDYYSYVRANPVDFEWKSPIAVLYGSDDNISDWNDISDFAGRYDAAVKVIEHGEHFFHTDEQLREFEFWIDEVLL